MSADMMRYYEKERIMEGGAAEMLRLKQAEHFCRIHN